MLFVVQSGKILWKNSLRPLSGCPCPLSSLHSGGCRLQGAARLSALVFGRKLLNRHRGHLHLQTSQWPQGDQQWTWELEPSIHPEMSPWSQPFQQWPALPSQSLQDLCRNRDQAGPPMSDHRRWCHKCAELPGPAITTSDPLSEPPCCCQGWQCPHNAEESLYDTEK